MKKNLKKTLILLVTLITMTFVSTVGVYADAIVEPRQGSSKSVSYDVIVADFEGDGYLNLRTGPGTGYDVICRIYDGTGLHITAEIDDGHGNTWGETYYNGSYGYVNLAYTRSAGSSGGGSSAAGYYVIVHDFEGEGYLNLRTGPGTSYSVICRIYDGTRLYIQSVTTDGSGNTWGYTTYNGNSGYVNTAYTTADNGGSNGGSQGAITPADYDVVVKATDGTDFLYLRNAPTMNSDVLTTIHDGTVLHITGVSTDSTGTSWGQTTYQGLSGFVSLLHTTAYVPTAAPTQAPTQAPTEAPTQVPTQAPTETPSTDSSIINNSKPNGSGSSNKPSAEAPAVTSEPKEKDGTPEATKAPAKLVEKNNKKSSSSFFKQNSTLIVVIIAAAAIVILAIILLLVIIRK